MVKNGPARGPDKTGAPRSAPAHAGRTEADTWREAVKRNENAKQVTRKESGLWEVIGNLAVQWIKLENPNIVELERTGGAKITNVAVEL
jgi:hypothetical protein